LKSKKNNFNLIGLQQRLKGGILSGGDLIIAIGSSFLSAPYQAGTLDAPGKEKLIVNFHQFDCTTFVETILALSRCAENGKLASGKFRRELRFIRYRGGEMDGYSSRLHYFTDWLRDNQQKKIIQDISKRLDGELRRRKLNFMTAHRGLYAALKNEAEFEKMRQAERNLSRKAFYIVGKDKIGAIKSQIQNGDIIAFPSNQEGLDVAHVGFAFWSGKNLHLLHASGKEGGVVISTKTLIAYLKQNKKYSGIIVSRPL
jgi:hypothetical protein